MRPTAHICPNAAQMGKGCRCFEGLVHVPPFSVGSGAYSPPAVTFPDIPAPEANRLVASVAHHNKLLALEVVRLRAANERLQHIAAETARNALEAYKTIALLTTRSNS